MTNEESNPDAKIGFTYFEHGEPQLLGTLAN